MLLTARRPNFLLLVASMCLVSAFVMSACSGSSPTASSSEPSDSSLAAAADGDLEDFALLAGDAFFNGDYDLLKPYVDEQTAQVFDAMVAGGLELRASDIRVASVTEEADGISLVRYAGEFCASAPTSGSSSSEGISSTDGETITESESTTSGDVETNCVTSTDDDPNGEQTALRFTRDGDGRWIMA